MNRKHILSLIAALCLCSAQVTAHAEDFSLTIMHTNDTHAMLGGTDSKGSPCYAAQCTGGKGGIVRLKQHLDDVRSEVANSILLDAGDQAQGTLFYRSYKNSVAAASMNMLEYDAATAGNHEFDNGCSIFKKYLSETKFPVLAANLTHEGKCDDPFPQPKAYTVIERSGRKIGIVGLMTPETVVSSRPCSALRITSPEEALKKSVAELQAQGVNIIVAVTHLGLPADIELAKKVDGVDVIAGGHTHSWLTNTSAKADGPYPVVEHSPSGQPVLIVTARNACRLLGRLDVQFDDAGVPVKWSGEPIVLDDNAKHAPDGVLAQMLEKYAEPLRSLMKDEIGFITAALPQGQTLLDPEVKECRVGECLNGNILADALLWGARETGAQAAFLNGGGVRVSLHTGKTALGDILATMPFENVIMTAKIRGSLLREVLEHGLKSTEEASGAFLQVAGMKISADLTRPGGSRLISAKIASADGTFEEIRPDGEYTVATLDFLTDGGNGYSMLSQVEWKSGDAVSKVIENYMRAQKTVKAANEGRIVLKR